MTPCMLVNSYYCFGALRCHNISERRQVFPNSQGIIPEDLNLHLNPADILRSHIFGLQLLITHFLSSLFSTLKWNAWRTVEKLLITPTEFDRCVSLAHVHLFFRELMLFWGPFIVTKQVFEKVHRISILALNRSRGYSVSNEPKYISSTAYCRLCKSKVLAEHPMKTRGSGGVAPVILTHGTRYVSGEPHSAALPSGIPPTVCINWDAGCASEPLSTFWRHQ
jgi:hypothetical protein